MVHDRQTARDIVETLSTKNIRVEYAIVVNLEGLKRGTDSGLKMEM